MVHPVVGARRPIKYNWVTRRFCLYELGGDIPPINSVTYVTYELGGLTTYELGGLTTYELDSSCYLWISVAKIYSYQPLYISSMQCKMIQTLSCTHNLDIVHTFIFIIIIHSKLKSLIIYNYHHVGSYIYISIHIYIP